MPKVAMLRRDANQYHGLLQRAALRDIWQQRLNFVLDFARATKAPAFFDNSPWADKLI